MTSNHFYLSGPMTGIPEYNFPAFHEAAARLRKSGWTVFNPAESFNGKTDLEWTTYMEHDFRNILESSSVMVLEGWDTALGAVLEVLFAVACGKNVFSLTGYGHERLFKNSDDARQMCEKLINDFAKNEAKTETPIILPVGQAQFADKETILEEAQRLVHGDRGNSYGHPLDDFTKSALIATAVLYDKLKPGVQIVAEDIPLLMQGVKISRETNSPKRDNRTDGAGYWETLDMVRQERDRRSRLTSKAEDELKSSIKENKKVLKKSRRARLEELQRRSKFEKALNEIEKMDLSDPAWNDYDEDGVPYWVKASLNEEGFGQKYFGINSKDGWSNLD